MKYRSYQKFILFGKGFVFFFVVSNESPNIFFPISEIVWFS